MTIAEKIASVWRSIEELESALRNSRNKAEQKEFRRDIDTLHSRLNILRFQLFEEQNSDPCQTPGCDNETDEHPTACTMCADRGVEHDV